MSHRNIVITGVNGFVGRHLARELTSAGYGVWGIGRENTPSKELDGLLTSYTVADLSAKWPTLKGNPHAIIHLAGLAAVGASFDNPQDYINLNSAMVTNMCEHYLSTVNSPRIVLISSGAVYDPDQSMPIGETGRISYSSPYTISKVLTENQAAYYNTRGIECVVLRPFNHIGPGQMAGFLVPDLVQKIEDRESEADPIQVGNLSTKRDYTDVRDVAKAYLAVAVAESKPRELVYNVCSGNSWSGEEILTALAEAMGTSKPKVIIDPALMRPNDSMDIRGDNSAFSKEFNWQPTYELKTTLEDFVNSRRV